MLCTLQAYHSLPKDTKQQLHLAHLPIGHLGVGDQPKFINGFNISFLVVGSNPATEDSHHVSEEVKIIVIIIVLTLVEQSIMGKHL